MKIDIVKLGGSVITGESFADAYDRQNTLRLAQELQPHWHGVILIHGTGLIGKPPAITHGYLADGRLPPEKTLIALQIRNDLRRLNQQVVTTFLDAGIPVTPFNVEHYFAENFSDLRAENLKDELLKTIVGGRVPVFYGDLMPMSDGSFQVLSSDVIALILARELSPRRCIFLSATPGVYARERQGEEIIERLDASMLDEVGRLDGPDVSGGMWAKINHALEIAKYCEECVIASGRNEGVIEGLLAGSDVSATRIFRA